MSRAPPGDTSGVAASRAATSAAMRSRDNTLSRCEPGKTRKPPFAGPEAVLAYLSRYTHRVAIANSRLIAFDGAGVTFRWKDYRAKNRERHKVMTLASDEFIRRFLLHVLPRGFMRIRHYGLLANRTKHIKLAAARAALYQPPPAAPPPLPESVAAFWLRIAALDIHQCPRCRAGRMRLVTTLVPALARPPPAPGIA